eukprot:gene2230-33712_t
MLLTRRRGQADSPLDSGQPQERSKLLVIGQNSVKAVVATLLCTACLWALMHYTHYGDDLAARSLQWAHLKTNNTSTRASSRTSVLSRHSALTVAPKPVLASNAAAAVAAADPDAALASTKSFLEPFKNLAHIQKLVSELPAFHKGSPANLSDMQKLVSERPAVHIGPSMNLANMQKFNRTRPALSEERFQELHARPALARKLLGHVVDSASSTLSFALRLDLEFNSEQIA